jgi:hypothetical protein
MRSPLAAVLLAALALVFPPMAMSDGSLRGADPVALACLDLNEPNPQDVYAQTDVEVGSSRSHLDGAGRAHLVAKFTVEWAIYFDPDLGDLPNPGDPGWLFSGTATIHFAKKFTLPPAGEEPEALFFSFPMTVRSPDGSREEQLLGDALVLLTPSEAIFQPPQSGSFRCA